MPTLGDLVNQKLKNTDGISFLPTLLGKSSEQKKHDYLYWEFGETGGAVAVRMGKWKGVRLGLKKNPEAPWQIFVLSNDIGEKNDLAAKHPELVKRFNEIVEREHMYSHIKEWEFINPKFKR